MYSGTGPFKIDDDGDNKDGRRIIPIDFGLSAGGLKTAQSF